MFLASVEFHALPHIGFAHHLHSEQHHTVYGLHHRGLEIAYITSGTLKVTLYGKTVEFPAGSVLVLPREFPVILESDSKQSHYTVQAEGEFRISISEDNIRPASSALCLPLISLPCAENELIKKKLLAIITDVATAREQNELRASLTFCEILHLLDGIAQQSSSHDSSSFLLNLKIKQHIVKHLSEPITLEEIAVALDKTPNYLNRVFRKYNQTTIIQYVNREKTELIAALLKQQVTFETACRSAGIADVSYGYRLFKKHTGLTPKQYALTVNKD